MIRIKVKAEVILTSIAAPKEMTPEELTLLAEQALNSRELLELPNDDKTVVGVRVHLQEVIERRVNW